MMETESSVGGLSYESGNRNTLEPVDGQQLTTDDESTPISSPETEHHQPSYHKLPSMSTSATTSVASSSHHQHIMNNNPYKREQLMDHDNNY